MYAYLFGSIHIILVILRIIPKMVVVKDMPVLLALKLATLDLVDLLAQPRETIITTWSFLIAQKVHTALNCTPKILS